MKPYVLTVTLNPAIDKTAIVSNFKIGKDFRENALFLAAGGKGINVSRVLQRLSKPTVATGFIGGPNGEYLKKHLDDERIKHDFCRIMDNARTSLTIIDPALNTITRVLERGPVVTKKDLDSFRRKYLKLLKESCYVVFSGRNVPGAPDSFYSELITIAKKNSVNTVFDTSGKPYELGLKRKPFMVKPNLKEAEQALGKKLPSFSQVKQAARDLHRFGIMIVAITMGSRGALVFNGKEMIMATPPKVNRLSPVGCGDAFIGGFIAYCINNRSLADCVRMAVACGAANTLHINPGFIKPADLKRIYKEVKIKNLGSR